MYINTGYLNHSLIDFKDKSRPLVAGWMVANDSWLDGNGMFCRGWNDCISLLYSKGKIQKSSKNEEI